MERDFSFYQKPEPINEFESFTSQELIIDYNNFEKNNEEDEKLLVERSQY